VQRFDAGGGVQDSFTINQNFSAGGMAVDGAGSVFVLAFGGDPLVQVVKHDGASGALLGGLDVASSGLALNFFSCAAGVAVDPADGTVYVAATDAFGAQVIASFDGATGAFIGTLDGSGSPSAGFVCPSGLAVDGSHRVYVLDGGRVDRYDAGGFGATIYDSGLPDNRGPPVAVTAVEARSATLTGTINPEGAASSYHFEYFYRLVGVNGSGSINGPGQELTTAQAAVTVDPSPPFVSAITPRSARLFGSINPNLLATGFATWGIEYWTTAAYGTRPAVTTPGGGFTGFCAGGPPSCGGDEVTGRQPRPRDAISLPRVVHRPARWRPVRGRRDLLHRSGSRSRRDQCDVCRPGGDGV
jgi:hypothetical protein